MKYSEYFEVNVKQSFDVISELVHSLRNSGATDEEIRSAIYAATSKALMDEVM